MVMAFSLPGMEILEVADSDNDDPEGNYIIQPIATNRPTALSTNQMFRTHTSANSQRWSEG